MKKIVVTGGSGKAGSAVLKDLMQQDCQLLSVDLKPPQDPAVPFMRADLSDLGQAQEALRGADVIIHLAGVSGPGQQTPEVTFRSNLGITYNVFSVATTIGVERVLWASSEAIYGSPFERERPMYAPIDEEHASFPETSYALSKLLSEELAWEFSRWSQIPFLGMRISQIMEMTDYQRLSQVWGDPWSRKGNLWSYVDVRDVAQAFRLALSAPLQDAEVCNIAAADTVMKLSNKQLLDEVFPDVPQRPTIREIGTLLSIEKARQLLGYDPRHSWRNYM